MALCSHFAPASERALGMAVRGLARARDGARQLRPVLGGVTSGLLPVLGTRSIRTGFFPEDRDFIDPQDPLFARPENYRWRYMDDPALQNSVLERSNVGMGMLVLNRRDGLDLPLVNDLYKRLRDLEVNTLKRFVGFTAMEPGPYCVGLDTKELLLAATMAAVNAKIRGLGLTPKEVSDSTAKRLPRFSRALLWHSQELAYLVHDYRKPFVSYISGEATDAGAALACLANFSGAGPDSEVSVQACFQGLVPTGGMTYVLAELPWRLGEFLALTGTPIQGADLVYIGLAKHWMSPEALPFLELTAEKHLEVSETDARALIADHSLPLPEGLTEKSSLPRRHLKTIDKIFSLTTAVQIAQALREEAAKEADGFWSRCSIKMSQACPLATEVTLQLIRNVKEDVKKKAGDAKTKKPFYTEGPFPKANSQLGEGYREHSALVTALRAELYAIQRLLCLPSAVKGLHAHSLGKAPSASLWERSEQSGESRPSGPALTAGEAQHLLLKMDSKASGSDPLFSVSVRSEFPLSKHPRLRQYHPNYDPKTGLDHDPAWMAQEVRRWDPKLFAEEREAAIKELLGDNDPALYGHARYTRVESRMAPRA